MSSAERERDRDRNPQEGETVLRSGVVARLSPAGKLRSELGASFTSANRTIDHDAKQGQRGGLRQRLGRTANQIGNNHVDADNVRRNSRTRNRRGNNRPSRRSGSRNRQRWSSSPAYHRSESPMSNDASAMQHNATRLRLFTRPTQHDVATRLLNRTRNTNRMRSGDVMQPNTMKADGNRVQNRNRKRKRLYSESVLVHTDNLDQNDILQRGPIRKKSGRFAKRRRFAIRRGDRNSDELFRSQSAQRANATRFAQGSSRFSPNGFGSTWRSPTGAVTLLDRPRISPPANSNEYLINEHNQIDGVSPIVYKTTSAHSTATTPFGGTYTFPYSAAYRPDYVEEPSEGISNHCEASNSKHPDDEAEVSTSSPNGPDEMCETSGATASSKDDEAMPADSITNMDLNRQHTSAAENTRAASRRRAQASFNVSQSQYDAEFSELYVSKLLDRFQQMNKQQLVTQCLSLSGEVELLEARLRDLKKQNDRLVRTGTTVHATPSNASVSSAVSSSAVQMQLTDSAQPTTLHSQCSVSSSNVLLDVQTIDESSAMRIDENEDHIDSVAAASPSTVEGTASCN